MKPEISSSESLGLCCVGGKIGLLQALAGPGGYNSILSKLVKTENLRRFFHER